MTRIWWIVRFYDRLVVKFSSRLSERCLTAKHFYLLIRLLSRKSRHYINDYQKKQYEFFFTLLECGRRKISNIQLTMLDKSKQHEKFVPTRRDVCENYPLLVRLCQFFCMLRTVGIEPVTTRNEARMLATRLAVAIPIKYNYNHP